jgi:uncharacterized RDD family membrane protein YckC
MNCAVCGEVCRCPLEPVCSTASLVSALEPTTIAAECAETAAAGDLNSSVGAAVASGSESEAVRGAAAEVADAPAWRDELSARLNRYRARRKVRPPRYPSLRLPLSLPFEAHELSNGASAHSGASALPAFESVSNHALALDGMRLHPSPMAETEMNFEQDFGVETAPQPLLAPDANSSGTSGAHDSGAHDSGGRDIGGHYSGGRYSGDRDSGGHGGAKIIEFPGFAWGPPAPPPDQLAEPVSGRPRILEVPEVAPPPPALGGITIEAAEHPEAEKRLGIDIPLQSAPLGRRLAAALIDGLIIAAASALFGFIFWKVAAVRPPRLQILGLAAGIAAVFWAAYQYLMIVYAGSTPGLRLAGLELARFDGTSASRSLRRWRVFASWLSAVSAGMGYVWVFLDEDALCWHDRITHTYLAPKKCQPQTEGR